MNEYKVIEDYVELYVPYKGETLVAYVDLEDLPRLLELGRRWFVNGNKRSKNTKYLSTVKMINRKRTKYYLHRFISDPEPNKYVDHINGNGLDNRKSNLRFVGQAENVQNKNFLNSDNTSGFRGVDFSHGKWRARLKHGGKEKHLGVFDDKEDAVNAVKNARANLLPFSLEAREGVTVEVKEPIDHRSLGSKSGEKGVHWDERKGKFFGRFMYKRKSYITKYYDTVEEAKSEVDKLKTEIKGKGGS